MKKPRIEDFDPKAVRPLGSPMDNLPRIERPGMVVEQAVDTSEGPVIDRTEEKREIAKTPAPKQKPSKSRPPRNRDTTIPRYRDTVVSRYQDTTIEQLRKAVIKIGKEAATHRFTVDEKKAIADIIYSNLRLGLRTSENEIARIAINFVIQDYRENEEGSILYRVLKALRE